ncbi:hypothetical protein [Pseudoroseomonas cervicalis]|uniref:hypothetical protein n=1 Tax=Teichococcus cervicalis TaxID=204525 RepID=UPI00278A9618|nr:hypothetical protein [Pseudoroseomonas cervicalis]MDQ1081416.1 hypothetical protein [Pseudoroseomonas cervicalis]
MSDRATLLAHDEAEAKLRARLEEAVRTAQARRNLGQPPGIDVTDMSDRDFLSLIRREFTA